MSDLSWDPEIPGQEVRLRDNLGRSGVTTGVVRQIGTRLHVQVSFGPNQKVFKPCDLVELCAGSKDPLDLVKSGRFGTTDDLRRILVYEKTQGQLTNVFYSMEASNTTFYAHQFKPVLKFLESAEGRLLIADEVGLGKTIEATFIWKELQARQDARRLLIVCPAMLREKWRDDLRNLFNIKARIVDARELLDEYRGWEDGGRYHEFVCIVSLEGLRYKADSDEEDLDARAVLLRALERPRAEPNELFLDLTIVDEAHYLRNPGTASNQLANIIRDASHHFLLLTATPIQTSDNNLYQLMRLVGPDTFFNEHIFGRMLAANAPVINALKLLWSPDPDLDRVVEQVDSALQHDYFQNNSLLLNVKRVLAQGKALDREEQVRLCHQIENSSLIGQHITRTRKRDVLENRVKRAPQTLSVRFSDYEKQLYGQVSNQIRSRAYGVEGIPLFILITRQRQMASSMVAAFQGWQEQGIIEEMLWDDLGVAAGLIDGAQGPSPFSRIGQGPLGDLTVDLVRLETEDSKYHQLISFLKQERSKNPREKFVLFAYFRPTLKYLERRLVKDGISCLLVTGGMGEAKYELLRQFREEDNCNVLLTSEVSSEGIDLQFCRFILNYDLPWNPMRIEQRIGRLDRLGQKSDRISIINFFQEDTIEDRILKRLYERIELFERSIGGMEEILGDITEELIGDLLSLELTDEERLQRAEQSALAAKAKKIQQERLDEESINLMAFSDYIQESIRQTRDQGRWLSPEEIFGFVSDFYMNRYRGSSFIKVPGEDQIYAVELSDQARQDLRRHIMDNPSPTSTRLFETTGSVECCFDPRLGKNLRRYRELIDTSHPLLRFVKKCYADEEQAFFPTAAILLDRRFAPSGLGPGNYVFMSQFWSFSGIREERRIAYQAMPLTGQRTMSSLQAESLIGIASRQGEILVNTERLPLQVVAKGIEFLSHSLSHELARQQEDFKADNENRCNVQERVAREFTRRRIDSMNSRIEKLSASGKQRTIPAMLGQIKTAEDHLQIKLARILEKREVDFSFRDLAVGVITIQ